MTGQRFDSHWSEKGRAVDFYDIKGLAEKLLGAIELKPSNHPFYKAGYQADVFKDNQPIGAMGCLHGDILTMLDIEGDIYGLELSTEAILEKKWQGLKEIPSFCLLQRPLHGCGQYDRVYGYRQGHTGQRDR